MSIASRVIHNFHDAFVAFAAVQSDQDLQLSAYRSIGMTVEYIEIN